MISLEVAFQSSRIVGVDMESEEEFAERAWKTMRLDTYSVRDQYELMEKSVKPIYRLGVKEKWKILDVGAQSNREVQLLKELGAESIGIDIDPESDADVIGDARDMPFDDNCFNAVMSVLVIPEIEEDKRVLREMKRVLKPDGKMMAVLFNDCVLNIRIQLSRGFVPRTSYYKLYTRKEIIQILEELGYEIENIYTSLYIPPGLDLLGPRIRDKIIKTLCRLDNRLSKSFLFNNSGKRLVVIARVKGDEEGFGK